MNKSCNKSSRVVSNLLQQNCYVRDVTRVVDLKTPSSSGSTFLSLDEEVSDTGVAIKLNPVPYPITPEYVASFADSADYRRDPANAVANGVKRANLGDCTDFQKITSMDSAAQYALFQQLQKKFARKDAINPDSIRKDAVNASTPDGGNLNG